MKSALSPAAEWPAIFPAGPLEADFKSAFQRDAKQFSRPKPYYGIIAQTTYAGKTACCQNDFGSMFLSVPLAGNYPSERPQDVRISTVVITAVSMSRPAFKFSSAQSTTSRFRELAPMVAALLFAAVFFCVGVHDAFKFIWFYTWEKVPCQLEKIEVVDDAAAEKPFSMEVIFHYEWQGRTYTSHEYGAPPHADYSTLKARRDVWLAAKSRNETFCRMNPGMPSEAVLETEGIRSGGIAFAVIGAMFLAIVGQVFWLALRGVSPQEEQAPRIALPFFLVMGTFGVGFLGGGLFLPAWKFHQAQSWTQTKAEVIWSAVREHRGSKNTNHSPDIFYRYTLNGKTYRSNHGKLSSGFSEGYQDSLNIVKAHPPGSWFSCYVNPEAPEEVARDREWRWSNLGALFGLPFAVLGVWGTGWSVRKFWRKRRIRGRGQAVH